MTDFRPYPKSQQLKSKRIKLTQKQKGDIIDAVDKQVKERSRGICESCGDKRAIDRAHLTGRTHIDHRTQVYDLAHLCKECHVMFDGTIEGIRMRRLLAAIINHALELPGNSRNSKETNGSVFDG
ncbi:hypothetical protein HUB98_26315 [Paenibacillus barcinonensis]|uniref:Uncharacterized protein n=1 Tax=Paenibacillus barcinonensis TaxID=198119 RepID=A0A2V4VYC2_PAEBA|nr:hypothetical protein [Paenibacillus barcinonensis]PYE52524.1 hypothetical protein DFQ00_101462 [Paenibacillus barcinonensis]QKS59319.1 hypothetical protein HUB98_26025 [Paenibacillus barcinonensis]QKS59373.1 hypothetical protein HUB98_26315 [Paenibacillus barcinonensis]